MAENPAEINLTAKDVLDLLKFGRANTPTVNFTLKEADDDEMILDEIAEVAEQMAEDLRDDDPIEDDDDDFDEEDEDDDDFDEDEDEDEDDFDDDEEDE